MNGKHIEFDSFFQVLPDHSFTDYFQLPEPNSSNFITLTSKWTSFDSDVAYVAFQPATAAIPFTELLTKRRIRSELPSPLQVDNSR